MLRRIPVIELNTPTVVLVGAPNVGKSSIVRAVSTGTPEVAFYIYVCLLYVCTSKIVKIYYLSFFLNLFALLLFGCFTLVSRVHKIAHISQVDTLDIFSNPDSLSAINCAVHLHAPTEVILFTKLTLLRYCTVLYCFC